VRTKRRRKRASEARVPLAEASRAGQRWSMDFVSDCLVGDRRIRVFAAIDQYTRECVSLEVGSTMPASAVTEALERAIKRRRTRPEAITCDNGTEFTSNLFDAWAHREGIKLDFIRPGRPVENGLAESFNARFRDECLNTSWFTSLDHARRVIDAWRRDYNETRPHSSLGDLAPAEYAARLLAWNAA